MSHATHFACQKVYSLHHIAASAWLFPVTNYESKTTKYELLPNGPRGLYKMEKTAADRVKIAAKI